MKGIRAILAGLVSLQAVRAAETAPTVYAPDACISVSAHESGTGRGVERNGSSNRDSYRTKALDIDVRNISRFPSGEIKVMAVWTGRRVDGTRKIFVHHAETLPASVLAASNAQLRMWCPLLAANNSRYSSVGDEGARIDGWFVIVTRDGNVVNSTASSPTYQRLLTSPAETTELLASFRPSGRSATMEMPHWRSDPARAEWRNRNSPYSISK